jgi:hypothetical protein
MYDVRESWTDERLDDFAKHVDFRFDEVDRRFGEVDKRFDKVEREMDRRFDKVEGELHRLNDGFAALNRTLLQIGGGVIATMIAGALGVIATQL